MEEEKPEKPEATGAAEPAPAATGAGPTTPGVTEPAPAATAGSPDTPGVTDVPPPATAEVPQAAAVPPPPAAKAEVPKAAPPPPPAAKAGVPTAAAAPAPPPAKAVVPKAPPATKPAPAAKAPRPRAPIDPTGRGGTASIFAGVAVIAPVLIRELTTGSDPFLLLPITLILLAVALGGLRVAQAGKDGKLGRIGFLLAAAGCLVLALMLLVIAYNDFVLNTRLQSGELLLDLGFYLLVAGLILFGAAALQAGALARGPMLLMLVSLPLGALLDLVGAFGGGNRKFDWGPNLLLGPGLHLGMKIMGLALIWMGYSILKTTKAKTEVKTG